jgi:hypothetical protein
MSNPKFVLVHRRDPNNVGDIAADPLQYFLNPSEYIAVDITQVDETEFPAELPIVVGGGGLLANELFGDKIDSLAYDFDEEQLLKLWNSRWILGDQKNEEIYERFIGQYESLIDTAIKQLKTTPSKRIIWGAGHNAKTNKTKIKELAYPSSLRDYDLVGIRDYGTGYNWVPCASCMHQAFDKDYEITNEVVWFEHKKQLIKNFGNDPIPRLVNSGSNIEQTIAFLGSAETIITNSYHGAYWGTLLGRKVILVDSWSTKFHYFKHKPYVLREGEYWRDALPNVPVYNNALNECRAATVSFWEQIQQEVN